MSNDIVSSQDRGTCWSLTINNPTDKDVKVELPAGWRFEGQPEVGEEGTAHLQLMLRTPQVRFTAVKKVFPRAHIEKARNPKALQKYVHKDETRAGESIQRVSDIPTLFEYQSIIASMWVEDEFQRRLLASDITDVTSVAMSYLDSLVECDIQAGRRGAEFIAINPMWRSSWMRFWRSIINRQVKYNGETQDQARISAPSVEEGSPA